MIAVDASSWIAYLRDTEGGDVRLVERALADRQVCMPPVVLAELLSEPSLPRPVAALFLQIPRLTITDGYWERSGALRARIIRMRRRAPLADSLIAQSCLDHRVALVTRGSDFRHFVRAAGLKLVA